MTGRMTDDGGRAPRGDRRQARRRARWEGPRPPKDWRYVVSSIGKVLIAAGLLMFGFVAYQLWGTGLEYAQAQDRLDEEFADLLAASPANAPGAQVTTTTVAPPTTTSPAPAPAPVTTVAPGATPTTIPAATIPAATIPPATIPPATVLPTSTVPVPNLLEGDVLARIQIPGIGLDAKVVAGVDPADLKQGPGHYPGTPMPGQLGNSAIAGHRTTYGEPFRHLDDIAEGDEIVVTTIQGRFVYRMTGQEIVTPSDGQVVATTDPTRAKLTLTTCDPVFTATNRLIVYAELDTIESGEALPPVLSYSGADAPATPVALPGEPVATAAAPDAPAQTSAPLPAAGAVSTVPAAGATTSTAAGATTSTAAAAPATSSPAGAPATVVPAAQPGADPSPSAATAAEPDTVDAFSHGWFSDDAAFLQVALWGLLLTLAAVSAYLVSRTARRNWAGALVGIVPFVMALYFFFQNVNRLLPAAL